jgi:hypothetical protein
MEFFMSVVRLLPVIIILSSQVGLGDAYSSDPENGSPYLRGRRVVDKDGNQIYLKKNEDSDPENGSPYLRGRRVVDKDGNQIYLKKNEESEPENSSPFLRGRRVVDKDGNQIYLKKNEDSEPERCSAKIKIQEDGKFLIEGDEKYNPRYSRVSGVDNDGHISIMSLNAVIDSHFKSRNGDKPYIFTKDDERLIKKASERMKSYFGGAFGIDTSGSYEDILKRATQDFFKKFVQKAIVDHDLELSEDEINGEVTRLLNIFKSNVESFESAEKLIAKGKVLKPEDNVLKSGLSSVFGIHFYDLKNEAVDSTRCKRDYPKAYLCGHEFGPRNCAFQQKNILSQTLCGRVEIKGTDKENLMHTISSDLVCSLSIESGIRTKIGDDSSPSGVRNE